MNVRIKLFGTILALLVMVGANPLIHAVVEVREQLPLYKDCNTGVVSNKPIVKKPAAPVVASATTHKNFTSIGSRIASPSSTNNTSIRTPNFSQMNLEELKQFLFEVDHTNPAMHAAIKEAQTYLMKKIALMSPAEQAAFQKDAQKAYVEFQKKQAAKQSSSVLSYASSTLGAVAIWTYFIAPAAATVWSKVVSPSLGFVAEHAIYPVTSFVGSKLFEPTVLTEEMMLAEKKAERTQVIREASAEAAQQLHEELMHKVGEKTGTNAVFNYFREKTPQVLYTTSSILAGVAITAALKKAGDVTGVSKAVEKVVYGDDEQKMAEYATKTMQYRHDLGAYKTAVEQGDSTVTEPEEPTIPMLAMVKSRVLPIASMVAQVMLYSHAVSPLVNGTFAYLFA